MNLRQKVDWTWDRNRCREFIAATTDRHWAKSACSYCVFAMTNRAGQKAVIERYRREPQAAARALFLEVVARSLNERQTLIAGSSAADLVAQAGLGAAQARFAAMLEECEHAIYEVRRITRRSLKTPQGRGITARSVRSVAHGERQQMLHELARFPGRRQVGADGIVRHHIRQRGTELPALEHFYVVCPAVVEDKQRPGFDTWWQEATTDDVLF